MIIVIKGKKYPLKSIEEVDLWALEELAAEGREIDRDLSLAAIEAIERDISKLKHRDAQTQAMMRARHPQAVLMQGLSMWASRRCAGEEISLREAMKTSYAEISYIREAGDDADDGQDPPSARPGSGRAAKRAPKARATRKTSAKR